MNRQKQLARWIFWEDEEYYCPPCMEKRLKDVNQNKEFSEHINYEGGDECGYYEDYANVDFECECCKCAAPLFSMIDC